MILTHGVRWLTLVSVEMSVEMSVKGVDFDPFKPFDFEGFGK